MRHKTDAGVKPLSEGEAREFMRRTGWLSRTPEEFSSRLLRDCKLLSLAADQLVYDIDDPPGGLYGLAGGLLGLVGSIHDATNTFPVKMVSYFT